MKEIKVMYHGDIKETIKNELKKMKEEGDGICHIGGKSKSNAIDLYLAEDVELEVFGRYYLDLGVSIKIPEGYKADVRPRSSTFSKFQLIQSNSLGLIDTSYSGKDDVWKMPVYVAPMQEDIKDLFEQLRLNIDVSLRTKNTSNWQEPMFRKIKVKKGTRLCQFEIFKVMEDFKIVESDLTGEKERGGLGSTGV